MTVNKLTPAPATIDVDLNEAIMINHALIEHLEAKWENAPTGHNEYVLYQAKDNQAKLIARRNDIIPADGGPCWICTLPAHKFNGEHLYITRAEALAFAGPQPDATAAAYNGASLRAEAGLAL